MFELVPDLKIPQLSSRHHHLQVTNNLILAGRFAREIKQAIIKTLFHARQREFEQDTRFAETGRSFKQYGRATVG